jgi:hypothetical protein
MIKYTTIVFFFNISNFYYFIPIFTYFKMNYNLLERDV